MTKPHTHTINCFKKSKFCWVNLMCLYFIRIAISKRQLTVHGVSPLTLSFELSSFYLKQWIISSMSREKREFYSTSALNDSLLISVFLKKSTMWSINQMFGSFYRVLIVLFSFLIKTVIPSQLYWCLHSPEFYFQGVMCFETHLALQTDYVVNVRTTKLVHDLSRYCEQLKSSHWDSI